LLLGKKIEINNLVLLIGGSPPQMLALNSSDFIPQFKLDDLVEKMMKKSNVSKL
jgi:hypothetical protein